MRLDKIVKVVSPNVLAAELETETSSMMNLMSEFFDQEKGKKKKRKTEGTSEKSIHSSEMVQSMQKLPGFFEGMIQKLTENATTNNSTK